MLKFVIIEQNKLAGTPKQHFKLVNLFKPAKKHFNFETYNKHSCL